MNSYRTSLTLAAAVALIAPTALSTAPSFAATVLPQDGRIVYAHFRDANYSWDIHTIDPNGRNDIDLSEERAHYEVAPHFSPDGTKIALESNYDVMVMNVDGSGRLYVTDDFNISDENDLTWSPDGQVVAFRSNILGEYQLFTAPADGSADPVRVSKGLDYVDDGYDWSPDGSHLLFSAYDGGVYGLYTAAPDGTGAAPLASPFYTETPSYSPDASKILFTRAQDLWLADADGGNAAAIWDDGLEQYAPEWSPAGDHILYLQGGADWKGLFVTDPDGSNTTLLQSAAADPVWSPSGTRIAYRSPFEAPGGEIYTINPDGTGRRRVTENELDDRNPDWGPACTVTGTASADILEGTAGRDVICAGPGSDVVYGRGGDDVILLGRGDDQAFGGAGGDVVAGEGGMDSLRGGGGADSLNTLDLSSDDAIVAGAGQDRCRKDGKDDARGCEQFEQPF